MQSAGRILSHLASGGKKTVVALAFVVIMAIMWARVLMGQKPDSATAAPDPAQSGTSQQEPPERMRFIPLPRVPGRNDSISRDFFAVQNRAYFQPNGAGDASTDTEVRVVSSDLAREVIQRLAQKLKLEAVLWSKSPDQDSQAFINNQLLRVGDKLTIKDGANSIDFEVLQIYEDSVLVGSGGTQLTLRLAQYLDVNN